MQNGGQQLQDAPVMQRNQALNISEERLLDGLAGKLVAHFSAILRNTVKEVQQELLSEKRTSEGNKKQRKEPTKAAKQGRKVGDKRKGENSPLASEDVNMPALFERFVSKLLLALTLDEDQDDPPEPGELQEDLERIGNNGK